MKNKLSDLKNHLFTALERLNDENLSDEHIKREIERTQAIAEIGKVIIDGAKTSLLHAKLTGKLKELDSSEYEDEAPVLKLERPKAEYSNKDHKKMIESYGG